MTTEFREVISHPNSRKDGLRLLMAIVPPTVNKNGCVILKIQKQMEQNEWDSDNEYVAYLSCADIGMLLVVLDGCKTEVMTPEVGDTKVSLMCIPMKAFDPEYSLGLYNADSMKRIALSIYEAEVFKEILRTALFRIVFG